MSEPYIGEIRMVGFNFAPQGWAFCDGSLQSITENPTLFNLIGTTYGGDGQETFALPNLMGRVAVHTGGGDDYVIGQQGGVETVTLNLEEIPAHSHSLMAQGAPGNVTNPAGSVWAKSALDQYSTSAPSTTMASSLQTVGGTQPHDNMGSYAVISFVISLFGVYPSQS